MRRRQILLSVGLATLLTAAGAASAVAQDFALQVGPPIAGNAQPAKSSWLVVRPGGCANPAEAQIDATAEGIVNGARTSVPLKLSALPTPGVHAVPKLWPSGGVWIVNLVGRCAGKSAGAIVSMVGPNAEYRREAVKLLPRPATPAEIDASLRALTGTSDATAVFAGGCFWGVEAVFEHVRGVRSVVSGYARYGGGRSRSEVPTEAVRVIYDPSTVTFEQLLDVFFTVAHDPTSRDRQGPDQGPEYRAVVYYDNVDQHAAADTYVATAVAARRFDAPIVTEIRSLGSFRVAEPFHQNYAAEHPTDPYIVHNDLPKLRHLQQAFPTLYQKNRAP